MVVGAYRPHHPYQEQTRSGVHPHTARHSARSHGNHDNSAERAPCGAGTTAGGDPPLHRPLGADRGARRVAGLLRQPRSDGRLPGRCRSRSRSDPPRSVEPGIQLRRRPVQRCDLGVDRDRVHARLRDHRADQLRARRRVHDRLFHRRGPVCGFRADAHHRWRLADRRPADHIDHHDARDRIPERPDRAGRLPAAAQRAQAGPADHGGRLLVHPAERRAALARWLAAKRARPDQRAADGVHHRRGPHPARLHPGVRGDDPARVRAGLVHQQHPRGPGDAGHRPGPRGRPADGHQRQRHDLADLPARRHAGRSGGAGVRALPDERLVFPGLQGRTHRVHGRGDGRDRQRPRRGARRPHHRRHPGAVRFAAGTAVDRGGRVRLPHRDHGPAPARAARRGDEGGRMSGLPARLRKWPEAAGRRLPVRGSRALAGFFIAVGIVLPFFFPQTSGFLNATIIAIAYAVMSLGLNVVVGFAGLLDLGYVAFYALGAYSLGWLGSGFFFKAQIHALVSPVASTLPGVHLNFILILIGAALICAAAGTVIGLPTLRLRGDYIAIVTLAFGEIIGTLAVNGQSIHIGGGMTLTAGNLGISAVDAPYFPGIGSFSLLNLRPWYWLIFAILLVVLFVNLRLRDSRLGRAWVALREDEVAAVSMGIPLVKTKLSAYAIGAAFGGMSGAFFGAYYTTVNAAQFQFGFSIFILAMVIIGALGSTLGAVR